MSDIFSPRVLIGWIAGAAVIFAMSLYLMGGGEVGTPESIGPSTFSRSAIGHAGIAELLHRLNIPVVKSRYDSLEKLSGGGILIIAEPRASPQTEELMRTLLKADNILLVLPKWTGSPSEQWPGWLRDSSELFPADAQWALRLVAPGAEVRREEGEVSWSTNALGIAPSLARPVQLIAGPVSRPLIAGPSGTLLAEVNERNRRVWVLSDPDVISNHSLARSDNAALAIAIINRVRELAAGRGANENSKVVFDETIHGLAAKPRSPFFLLLDFPFVIATSQCLIAIALLLWATMGRFGLPQSAPLPLSAGRGGLLDNIAKLIEFTGHQPAIVARYVRETVRDVACELHAPRTLSGAALTSWLERVGGARGVSVGCGALIAQADALAPLVDAGLAVRGRQARQPDSTALVRLARDTHRWKGEILDGRPRDSVDRGRRTRRGAKGGDRPE
ncbi:MAG: DUF4350 domain-containing protein [Xanthobacteraceae bacterium]